MKFPAEFRLPRDILQAPPVSGHILGILPLDGRFSLSVGTGRMALATALDSLPPSRMSGRAWLPSLCCASLALPLLRRGFEVRFYSSPDEISSSGTAPGDLFLYIHFCGFPNRAAERVLEALPAEKRPIIVEDCAHALFTPGVGTFGDFVLYSFRKLLPVPDGALLLSRIPLKTELEPPLEAFISAKTLGMISGSRELLLRGEELLDGDSAVRAPSEAGRFILERTEWVSIPGARRNNCRLLAGLLGIPLPSGRDAVPLGLPVRTEKGGAELERRLRAAGFEPPLSWELPPGVPQARSGKVVILPCDERMEENSLNQLSAIYLEWKASQPLYQGG